MDSYNIKTQPNDGEINELIWSFLFSQEYLQQTSNDIERN